MIITYTEQDVARFRSKIVVTGECWIWHGSKIDTGYGKMYLKCVKEIRAHKFSYIIHSGQQVPPGLQINHTCGVKLCVNPEHLYAGTHADNMNDIVKSGKQRGESNGATKLTEAQVLEIRAKYVPNVYTLEKLAQEYGVCDQQIHNIITRKAWPHI